jgi:hypothetical protein
VYVIAEAQIVQQLLLGLETPKTPPPMFMQLLKFYLFFHCGRVRSLLICPFNGLKEENMKKWM